MEIKQTIILPTLNEIVAKKAAVHIRNGRSVGVAGLNAYREFSEEVYKLLTDVVNAKNVKQGPTEFMITEFLMKRSATKPS